MVTTKERKNSLKFTDCRVDILLSCLNLRGCGRTRQIGLFDIQIQLFRAVMEKKMLLDARRNGKEENKSIGYKKVVLSFYEQHCTVQDTEQHTKK